MAADTRWSEAARVGRVHRPGIFFLGDAQASCDENV